MVYKREDVWTLGGGWSGPVKWYAKGVGVLQSRPITDVTSWHFLAAMHGIDFKLWQDFGYLKPKQPLPLPAVQQKYWAQCQHQSWYFLPWHRGYVAAFEAIVRAAIVGLKGPADWALPYWNYNNQKQAHARELPPAFADKTMPDGSVNPLFVSRRYGDGSNPIVLDPREIRLVALNDDQFEGGAGGVRPGFGGPGTLFHHGGEDNSPNGALESEPHNNVHGAVGGSLPGKNQNDPRNNGLMSMPDTAALDPIFWLHHANIDRLWEVWRQQKPAPTNPTDPAWLTGPLARPFAVPTPAGKDLQFAAKDVLDIRAPNLNYEYEDVTPPAGPTRTQRFVRLGAPAALAQQLAIAGTKMGPPGPAELIGSNEAALSLVGGAVDTKVRLDATAKAKVARSLNVAASGAEARQPDRIYLKLENLRGLNDAAIFYVYVGLPPGADPKAHPDRLAGTVSLFGVTKASERGGEKSGNGINQVFEITDIVDALHLDQTLGALDHLNVRFVPRTPVQPESEISVGRVSIFRESQ
jgi:tyrosinase